MHSEPIYEGDEDIPHPMDLVHIEQLPHVITPPNNHTPNHQYSNLNSSMNSVSFFSYFNFINKLEKYDESNYYYPWHFFGKILMFTKLCS